MMDLGNACAQADHKVAAIVHHHESGAKFEQVDIDGVSIYRVPCHGQLMFAPVSPTFGYWLNRVIDEFKPDVLHIHMPNTSAFFALFSAKAKKIPWVVHWHSDVLGDDSPWFLKTFYPLYQPFERAVMNRAASIIATSPPYLAVQPGVCGAIQILLKWWLLAFVHAPSLSMLKPHQGLQLLIVGRLTYYKGHRFLIDAMNKVPDSVKLNIVGDGELRQSLNEQIERLGLGERVKLLGKVSQDELARQFAGADCVCLPSIERTEAFGVVLMEAAACSVPAIVSDVPGSGMGWVVQHEQTGLVVERSNADALAEAITQLSQSPQTLQQYAVNARARFESEFQIARVAGQTLKIYQNCVKPLTNVTSHTL